MKMYDADAWLRKFTEGATRAQKAVDELGAGKPPIIELSRAQAKKIGDAIAVAIIRVHDDDPALGDLMAALDELQVAWGEGAPIGWRCLT